MLDSSHLPFDENIDMTRKVVEVAHALNAFVEAELGHLPDASNPDTTFVKSTDPEDAAIFVAKTGVDALAVSIGNTHLLVDGKATIDLGLLDCLHQRISIPLVIHGGTGFPDQSIKPAIERGVAKFNYGTRLKQLFLNGVKLGIEALPNHPNIHHYVGSREEHDVMSYGKRLMKVEISRLINLYGSAGKAASW